MFGEVLLWAVFKKSWFYFAIKRLYYYDDKVSACPQCRHYLFLVLREIQTDQIYWIRNWLLLISASVLLYLANLT